MSSAIRSTPHPDRQRLQQHRVPLVGLQRRHHQARTGPSAGMPRGRKGYDAVSIPMCTTWIGVCAGLCRPNNSRLYSEIVTTKRASAILRSSIEVSTQMSWAGGEAVRRADQPGAHPRGQRRVGGEVRGMCGGACAGSDPGVCACQRHRRQRTANNWAAAIPGGDGGQHRGQRSRGRVTAAHPKPATACPADGRISRSSQRRAISCTTVSGEGNRERSSRSNLPLPSRPSSSRTMNVSVVRGNRDTM